MKIYRYLLFLLTCICLITSFSCEEENSPDSNISIEQLKHQIQSNPDFLELISENESFSNDLFTSLNASKNMAKLSNNIEQVIIDLSLAKEYETYMENVEILSQNLERTFPEIKQLTEQEIQSLVFEFLKYNKQGHYFLNRVTDCDAQFQANMQDIHIQYDTSIALCTIASISTAGAAVPCYAAAVATAVLKTAAAIDEHTLCIQNQTN